MRREAALFTDLYELTMAQAYFREGMTGQAVFETYFRRLPEHRSYVVAAGLEDVVEFAESFRFEKEEVEFLRSYGLFSDDFLRFLGSVRFTGAIRAIPEGTVVFPYEPLVQVIAPILEAQLLETFVLNQIHLQSVIASKAARIVEAARGRSVIEFGSRRAHGLDAGVKAVRAAYLSGAEGTSNVLASKRYGVPAFGTMAHSFVQAFDREIDAFRAFSRSFPGATLLVDTYDTIAGVDRVIELVRDTGADVHGVRLDSGDLGALAREARARLDEAGLRGIRIFASSGLDEGAIDALLEQESPIDGFGVGTSLAVSSDAPTLDVAYKLVEYDGRGRTKLSPGKPIFPGRKQVFRVEEGGLSARDIVAHGEEGHPGRPLLVPVLERGGRTEGADLGLERARERALSERRALPRALRSIRSPSEYPVEISPLLQRRLRTLRAEFEAPPLH